MIRTGDTRTLLSCLRSEITYKAVLKVIAFVNNIVAFRILGLRGFGQLAFLDTAAGIAGAVVDTGTDGLLSRYLPLFKSAAAGAHRICALVILALVKTLIFGALAAAILFATTDVWLPWFHSAPLSRYESAVFVVNTLLVWLTNPIYTFLIQNYDVPYLNKRTLWTSLFNIGAFYAAYFTSGITIASLLTVQLMTTCMSFSLLAIRCRHFLPSGISWWQGMRSLRAHARDMTRYAAVLWVSSLAEMATARRGREYFIQTVLGSQAMGIYALGKKLETNIVEIFHPKTLRETVGYRAYELWESAGGGKVRDFLAKYVTLTWLSMGSAILPGIVVLPYFLNKALGINRSEDVLYLQFALVCALLLNWMPVMSHCINLLKKPAWFVAARILTFPLALCLYSWLTPTGLLGNLAAFAALFIAENLLYAAAVRRTVGLPFHARGLIFVTLCSALALLAGLFTARDSFASAFGWGLAMLAVFLLAMATTGGGLAAAQLLSKTRFAAMAPGSVAWMQALCRRN